MYYISNICFICLKDIKNLQTTCLDNTKDPKVQQIKFILPEIMLESEFPIYICSTCHTELNSFYTFKKLCLENYRRFKYYQKLLEGSSDSEDELQSEIGNDKQEKPMVVDLTNTSDDQHEENKIINDEDKIDIKEDIKFEAEEHDQYKQILSNIKSETDCVAHLISEKTNQDGTVFNTPADHEHENQEKNSIVNDAILNISDSSEDITIDSSAASTLRQYEINCSNTEDLTSNNQVTIDKDEIEGYTCPICNKKFSRISYFKKHKKIHTEIKDLQCSICHKIMLSKSGLLCHIKKVHTGAKQFSCTKCSETFFWRVHLNSHMKKRHKE